MFFDTEEQRILLGNSVPLPEADLDDDSVQSDTGYPDEESALMQYYFFSAYDGIGKPNFKSDYLSVKNQIFSLYTLKEQQMFVNSIMNKVVEVYDYEPTEKFDVNSYEELDDVYKFLEFLEYDNEEFIISVWKFLKPDIKNLDIEGYCKSHSDKIIREIEEQLVSRDYTWLISDFLRTNNKENMIEWFSEKSKNLITLIKIGILEGEMNA